MMNNSQSPNELEHRPEVREALREIGMGDKSQGRAKLDSRNRLTLLALGVFCVMAILLYSASRVGLIPILRGQEGGILERTLLGIVILGMLLLLSKLIDDFVIVRVGDAASRFNLRRVMRLFTALAIGLVLLSLIFRNWYTALVSLGFMSLILGFALQTPITSFIGWIYILVNTPYRVGDRIKIGDATGDVIDVGYFDTTLWEFGGQYLSTDHPSGRIIKFPNSNVLNAAVYNYSWPLFPYIWNEVKFNIAYGSDFEFVARTMEEVVAEEIGGEMIERVREYREILAKTPVDEIEVQEKPVVLFRVSDNTWIEVIVRYLVDPIQAGAVKTRLIQKLLPRLNAAQDRVMFPRGDAR
jgi:small-conductance mechanosensitive channel